MNTNNKRKYSVKILSWDKKMSVLVEGISPEEVKENLKRQGYSVVHVDEFQESSETFYHFVVHELGDENKEGKIQAQDILTAYTQLVEKYGYDVVQIYSQEHVTQEERDQTTTRVKKLYDIATKGKKSETPWEKKKNAITMKKVVALQKDLALVEGLYEEVMSWLPEGSDTTAIDAFSVELKKAKNISNTAKIQDLLETVLLSIGSVITSAELEEKQGKHWCSKTNKLLKKIGSWKRFSFEKKEKNESKWAYKEKILAGVRVIASTDRKKKDAFTSMKLKRACENYMREAKGCIRSVFTQGFSETLLHLQAIEERIFEITEKKTWLRRFIFVCMRLFLVFWFSLVLFALLMLSGYIYAQVDYFVLLVLSVLSLIVFFFYVGMGRVYLVLWVVLSILLGVLLPNF